jgi:hypothetical protein
MAPKGTRAAPKSDAEKAAAKASREAAKLAKATKAAKVAASKLEDADAPPESEVRLTCGTAHRAGFWVGGAT